MQCKNCGLENQAAGRYCSNCGLLLAQSTEDQEVIGEQQLEQANTQNSDGTTSFTDKVRKTVKSFEKFANMVLSVVIFIAVCIGGYYYFEYGSFVKGSVASITAKDLAKTYEVDIKKGDSEYKDKGVTVSGQVLRKGQFNNSDDLYVEIYNNAREKYAYDKYVSVLVAFPMEKKELVNKIKNGDFVQVRGTCVGFVKQEENRQISVQIQGKSLN